MGAEPARGGARLTTEQSRKFFHSFFSVPFPFLFFPLRKEKFSALLFC
jgi:hypothetical protein